MIKQLTKLANHLDSRGLSKEADYLDAVIRKVATEGHDPTVETSEGAGAGQMSEPKPIDYCTVCIDLMSSEEFGIKVASVEKEIDGWKCNDSTSATYSMDVSYCDKIMAAKNIYSVSIRPADRSIGPNRSLEKAKSAVGVITGWASVPDNIYSMIIKVQKSNPVVDFSVGSPLDEWVGNNLIDQDGKKTTLDLFRDAHSNDKIPTGDLEGEQIK